MSKRAGGSTKKPRWVTGWIRGAVLTVVVIGGLLGLQIWNRNAAIEVALTYERACEAQFTVGQMDLGGLSDVLRREDAEALAPATALPDDARWQEWAAEGGAERLAPSAFTVMMVTAGMKSGVVSVRATSPVAGGSLSTTRDVHLVREGLSWKVDARKSPRSGNGLGVSG